MIDVSNELNDFILEGVAPEDVESTERALVRVKDNIRKLINSLSGECKRNGLAQV